MTGLNNKERILLETSFECHAINKIFSGEYSLRVLKVLEKTINAIHNCAELKAEIVRIFLNFTTIREI
jgi:hypothetical protein